MRRQERVYCVPSRRLPRAPTTPKLLASAKFLLSHRDANSTFSVRPCALLWSMYNIPVLEGYIILYTMKFLVLKQRASGAGNNCGAGASEAESSRIQHIAPLLGKFVFFKTLLYKFISLVSSFNEAKNGVCCG